MPKCQALYPSWNGSKIILVLFLKLYFLIVPDWCSSNFLMLQNGSVTPEKKSRSRPPSYAGGESPVNPRSRSSTSDSLKSGSSPNSNYRQMPPPPPPKEKKPSTGGESSEMSTVKSLWLSVFNLTMELRDPIRYYLQLTLMTKLFLLYLFSWCVSVMLHSYYSRLYTFSFCCNFILDYFIAFHRNVTLTTE
jgi:hypothetical protein